MLFRLVAILAAHAPLLTAEYPAIPKHFLKQYSATWLTGSLHRHVGIQQPALNNLVQTLLLKFQMLIILVPNKLVFYVVEMSLTVQCSNENC